MLVSAQRVVGERADHIAIADRVVAMASDDALELMLQPSELGDLFPHGGKMLGGDAVRLAAGAFGCSLSARRSRIASIESPRSRAWRMKASVSSSRFS